MSFSVNPAGASDIHESSHVVTTNQTRLGHFPMLSTPEYVEDATGAMQGRFYTPAPTTSSWGWSEERQTSVEHGAISMPMHEDHGHSHCEMIHYKPLTLLYCPVHWRSCVTNYDAVLAFGNLQWDHCMNFGRFDR